MLYTDSQNHFLDLQNRALRGEAVETQLDPGYQEYYEAWINEESTILSKLSTEERVEHFTAYLQKALLKKKQAVVEALPVDEDRKKELRALAQKDQLLLVSTDGGEHFEEVLTADEAKQKNPLDFRILSSTLASATNDLGAVVEEQTLLHVVSNLKGVGYHVDHAELKNHKVVVQVTLPKVQADSEPVQYEVDVSGDPLLPLEYACLSGNGAKHFAETALPEELKKMEEKSIFTPPTPQEWLTVSAHFAESSANGNSRDKRADLALASLAGTLGVRGTQDRRKAEQELALEQAWEREKMDQKTRPITLNVIEAKKIRAEQEQEEVKDKRDNAFKREARTQKYEAKRAKSLAFKKKTDEAKSSVPQGGANFTKKMASAALLGGAGFTGFIAGLGVWAGQ